MSGTVVVCRSCGRAEEAGASPTCSVDGAPLDPIVSEGDPILGRIIDRRYAVLRKLGEGGMGAVYVARQLSVQRDVALKVLHGNVFAGEQQNKRFRREAMAVSKLRGRNIVVLHDFGCTEEKLLYLVMELLEGETLGRRVSRRGPLSELEAAAVLDQVLAALDEAHAVDMVHRDLKPENIFLVKQPDGSELAKVLDFGVARLAAESEGRLTASGVVPGTPAYMAPEAFTKGAADRGADFYALGVTAFEVLTGRLPFEQNSLLELASAHVYQRTPQLAEARPGGRFSKAVQEWVARLMEKVPERRPATAHEARRLLRIACPQAGLGPLPPPAPATGEVLPSAPTEEVSALGTDAQTPSRMVVKRLPPAWAGVGILGLLAGVVWLAVSGRSNAGPATEAAVAERVVSPEAGGGVASPAVAQGVAVLRESTVLVAPVGPPPRRPEADQSVLRRPLLLVAPRDLDTQSRRDRQAVAVNSTASVKVTKPTGVKPPSPTPPPPKALPIDFRTE